MFTGSILITLFLVALIYEIHVDGDDLIVENIHPKPQTQPREAANAMLQIRKGRGEIGKSQSAVRRFADSSQTSSTAAAIGSVEEANPVYIYP